MTHVVVGDSGGILIPSLEDHPLGKKALRGLRLVHTHLGNEPLTEDDMTDLALLRLDLVAALGARGGLPGELHVGYLSADGPRKEVQDVHHPAAPLSEFLRAIEDEMERRRGFTQSDPRERAILISISTRPRFELEDSMAELRELALSSDLVVLDAVVQRVKRINPRYLMGEGKIKELVINALTLGATLLVFDQDLSPSQVKAIGEMTELKAIDRSQLILDIFARRAHTRDGRVQVELAQLKYLLPRLMGKGTAMSRLMGGIGGRGPGESKLEVDRRRVRDRIANLERELKALSSARRQRKSRRLARGLPIVSIVGYTNAGKSTLLNTLTKSGVFTERRMFATLDTSSRRLRLPRERDVIITDTVGFIRDLPEPLIAAFKATLEELEDADLLLHVVDASSPRYEAQMASVGKVLEELGLGEKPQVVVLNKCDRISPEEAEHLAARYGGVAVSALDPSTMGPLLERIGGLFMNENFSGPEV